MGNCDQRIVIVLFQTSRTSVDGRAFHLAHALGWRMTQTKLYLPRNSDAPERDMLGHQELLLCSIHFSKEFCKDGSMLFAFQRAFSLSHATCPIAASCAPVPVRSTTMSSLPVRPAFVPFTISPSSA